jgi:hypothetical protein
MELSLSEFDRDEFLHIQKHLILFTNKKFKIYDKFKTIKDISNLSKEDMEQGILPIRKKMYDVNTIQDFCEKNVSPQ